MVHPYRVFICYAHEDKWLAERVEQALKQLGLQPWYDPHITPGTPFTDAIKSMITHAHLFIPLITENSQMRPWVHQETGYATALNIPVLPIAVETVPGEMIAQLQAVVIPSCAGVHDIVQRLQQLNLERLVTPRPAAPRSITETAEWLEDRTKMLAEYAREVWELSGPQKIRQQSALSSFSIPDADVGDSMWVDRDGYIPRSPYLHALLREERRVIEIHAREAACSLIISPTFDFADAGPIARKTRLKILRDALVSLVAVGANVSVVTSPYARYGKMNLTIVGDWFVALAGLHRPGPYRQTVFSWHGPTVLEWTRRFDQQFDYLCSRAKAKDPDVVGPEPEKVIKRLDKVLRTLGEENNPARRGHGNAAKAKRHRREQRVRPSALDLPPNHLTGSSTGQGASGT